MFWKHSSWLWNRTRDRGGDPRELSYGAGRGRIPALQRTSFHSTTQRPRSPPLARGAWSAEPSRPAWRSWSRKTPSITANAVLAIPWNLVYDADPAEYKDAFQTGRIRAVAAVLGDPVQPDLRPAGWSRCGGRSDWTDPRVVVVIDPAKYDRLHERPRSGATGCLPEGVGFEGPARRHGQVGRRAGAPRRSLDELEAARSRLSPAVLARPCPPGVTSGWASEIITPRPTCEDLLIRLTPRGIDRRGCCVFLNACPTGEAGRIEGSFLDVMKHLGLLPGSDPD